MSTLPDPLADNADGTVQATRRRLPAFVMPLLRAAFLVLVVGFIWWGVHDRLGEVHAALSSTSPGAVIVALVLVLVGLLCTGLMWRALLPVRVPLSAALGVFFVGQLGKYLPGSVWSFGAQAQLARRHRVPARTTVAASLVFLGINVATAVLLGGLVAASGGASLGGRGWLFGVAALVALVCLHPGVVRWLARKVAGTEFPLSWGTLGRVLGLMVCAWGCYAAATGLLGGSGRPAVVAALAAAMLLAYAAGVVVVLAPAGLGAREATFVAIASPVAGFATAAAVALLSRVVFTAADLIAAGVAWAAARPGGRPVGDPDVIQGGVLPGGVGETVRCPEHRSLSLKDEPGA